MEVMREFLFSLTYSPGVDDYMDAFIENESLRSEAIISCLDTEQLWRIERVTGDPETLDRLDTLLLDETLDRESISTRACRGARRHSLLEADARSRVVYTYLSEVAYCDAVPLIAVQYLTGGLVFETVRRRRRAQWRILMQDDEKIGMVYDTLGGRLADGIDFEFGHLEETTRWQHTLLSSRSLRSEQQQVLELAVERGYFETPREVTLDELAAELDVPRSTVSYRLRRATAELAKEFVEEDY
jgi:predicted DNA binding protein